MNIVLWILQVLLAAAFLAHGWMMLMPPPELAEVIDQFIARPLRLFIGVAEVLAAAGLTLPGVTRIWPWLTPLAAAGLMIVTASAAGLHLVRSEYSSAATTAVLFILTSIVGYLRWKVYPITPRGSAAVSRSGRLRSAPVVELDRKG